MLDLALRFIVGGAAVVACYVLQYVVPWPALAGIFAAFPAVMTVAVGMAGRNGGTRRASSVARGAVYGMLGGLLCAATVALLITANWKWPAAVAVGLSVWLTGSLLCLRFLAGEKPRRALLPRLLDPRPLARLLASERAHPAGAGAPRAR